MARRACPLAAEDFQRLAAAFVEALRYEVGLKRSTAKQATERYSKDQVKLMQQGVADLMARNSA